TYTVQVRPAAVKALKKLDRQTLRRIQGVIALLAEHPYPPAAKRLTGRPEYSVRTGNYRVLYRVADTQLLVIVVELEHRRDIYRT
ncbi:MAG: type II toxin-antitoxin system RelE family toxin, partial [Mycobacteriales bacterium]